MKQIKSLIDILMNNPVKMRKIVNPKLLKLKINNLLLIKAIKGAVYGEIFQKK